MVHSTDLFAQRLFKGKLHLPYFSAQVMGTITESMDTIQAHPICGRQLSNHRAQRAQIADRAQFAGSVAEFSFQLMSGRACRFCAYKSGLLVRTVQVQDGEADDE